MKVLIFGATGMVGQGALRECLLDPKVELVQTVGRTPTGQTHPKLRELAHGDLWNYSTVEAQLKGFDACFFCLGTPSSGKTEAEYTRITYDLTMAAAATLARLDPAMTFVYVSGEGADGSEKGSVRWARVRGRTENAVLALPLNGYVFRPGFILPLHGIQSKTALYRWFYVLTKPLGHLGRALLPGRFATTTSLGQAMLAVAERGASKKILRTLDFEALARSRA
jgi:uncharacterized protein YbjT (DUF2867 family)